MEKKIRELEFEQSELNTLIKKGVTFEVVDTEVKTKTWLWGLIKKRTPEKVIKSFKIEEPTLGTLLRMSAEWIAMEIEETKLQEEAPLTRAKLMVNKHADRFAKILALAVLGSDYLLPKGNGQYTPDEKSLQHLTDLFLRAVQPSKLYELCVLVNTMCNYGDFMNSIRLMSAVRVTMPLLVEEKPATDKKD